MKAMSRFHRYSVHNIWLIVSQRPTATRVAGFQTWRTLGRFVRRGEKGIAILAPIVGRRHDESSEDAELRQVLGFRAVYVFDVSQTDGEPLPESSHASGDPGVHRKTIVEAIRARGIVVEFADDLDGAQGRSYGGRIEILNGLSPAEEFGTIAHEFAHELLHRAAHGVESRDTRELEAEAVAFVVSQALSIEHLASSRDYIHLYRGNSDMLMQSLDRIQRTASTILTALEPAA
jgi:antirestriction protein ArdC